MTAGADTTDRAHRRRRFAGRDTHEAHRAATPLELLFDLTFVVAFGVAADQLAHYLAQGQIGSAVGAFAFATFAVSWAWINYSWFASAYDTDDWVFRLATMVQMVGVIVLALGLQQAFASIVHGDTLDNGVMVAGYVVMRVPMVFLWAQVARDDPEHRSAAWAYISTISVAQVFWVVLAIIDLPIEPRSRSPCSCWRSRCPARGSPNAATAGRPGTRVTSRSGTGCWSSSLSARAFSARSLRSTPSSTARPGGRSTAAVVAIAGIGLIFATWWTYFAIPWADVLERHRERSFVWGYGHIVLFGALAAIGAGLHVAALYLDRETALNELGTVLCTVVPVAIYIVVLYGLYASFTRHLDPFHLWLLGGSAAVLALSVVLAALGVSIAVCLLVLMFTPIVTVVGYETLGHRHVQEALARTLAAS